MDEDDQILGESVNTTGQVKQKRKPRTASSARSQVVSFRLSARAQEQLEALADEANLSESKFVERLIHRAADDPDSYYTRLAAYHSMVCAAAILAIANALNPSLPRSIIAELAPALRNALGPLPPPPVSIEQDELVSPATYNYLEALLGLARGAGS